MAVGSPSYKSFSMGFLSDFSRLLKIKLPWTFEPKIVLSSRATFASIAASIASSVEKRSLLVGSKVFEYISLACLYC